ncbi:unnamed protein product [Linum tenue]|uniref:SPX domain-containing protein n=1 Tax=Linum tenue TaxID=586396 RepID=A0AAV0KWI5_9ROSI|nr:unnamed protein product [Linum tenue]
MVAFGKKLKQAQVQEWQGYYINYKLLKKRVKRYSQAQQSGTQDTQPQSVVLKDFSRLLDSQIEKIVLFILEQQGELAAKLASLGDHQHHCLTQQQQQQLS